MSTKDPLVIIQDEPSKYHFKTKDNQRVDIEHRDDDFIYLTLYKWGEEASLQIVLDKVPVHNHTFLENRIEVENPDFLLRVYPIDTRSTGELYGDSDDVVQCQDGGFRFEIVLKKKRPAMDNSFTFPVISKNMRFSYQPFLTQEEIDQGVIRPLNMEGGYAVYHISKKNNQYMTGKVFDAPRPIAEDALGNKAWCSIHFDKNVDPTSMTVTVPQQFLDEAMYPVTIDPDFGYTSVGATSETLVIGSTCYRLGSAWAMPAGGGTANYIRARIWGTPVPDDCTVFINQKDSGGVGTHAQIATKENLGCAIAEHWEEFTLASEALTGGTNYILNIVGKGLGVKQYFYVKYDSAAPTALASYNESQYYITPESPWVVAAAGSTYDYSIYCNYTAAAGGLRMTLSLKGHMGYDLKTRGGKARRRVF